MRVYGVTVGKLVRQLRHHGLGIAQIPEGNVGSFNRLHKALGYPIGLLALHRGGDRTHVDRPGKGTCFSDGVAAAVVRKPLDRTRRCGITSKALLDCSQHHVFNQASINAFGGSLPANRLSITAVQGKSHSGPLFVPTVNLKPVRAPAQITLINRHPTVMSAGVVVAPDALGQQKLVLFHQAVDTLAVNPRGLRFQSTVSYRLPNSRIALAELGINCPSDLFKDDRHRPWGPRPVSGDPYVLGACF